MKNALLYISTSLIVTSLLFSQETTDTPFDFSGQFGATSINGLLLWHHDWNSGTLLFDRSIGSYPTRYGSVITDSVKLNDLFEIDHEIIVFDTSETKTWFNYQRGQFDLDQLAVGALIYGQSSRLAFNGFKRSFSGSLGELHEVIGQSSPIQQSFRLNYSSSAPEIYQLDLSLAHFTGGSALPDSNGSGEYNDELTTSGIRYKQNLGIGVINLHGGQVNFTQDVERPMAGPDVSRVLAHNFFSAGYSRPVGAVGNIEFSMIFNRQMASGITRNWSTLVAGYSWSSVDLSAGTSLIGGTLHPYINSGMKYEIIGLQFEMDFKLKSERTPLIFSSTQTAKSQEWLQGYLEIGKRTNRFSADLSVGLTIIDDFHELISTANPGVYSTSMAKADMLHSKLQLSWYLTEDWLLEGGYANTAYNAVTISDGIRDRVKLSLEGKLRFILKERMQLYGRFEVEGWLNRDPDFMFDPIRSFPYKSHTSTGISGTAWPVALQIRAVISSVTLIYRIDNLGHRVAPLLSRINPSYNDNSQFISGNTDLLPMGSLVRFGIEWNFDK